MLKNIEGQAVPEVTFHTRQNDEWLDVTTNELFSAKNVIVFSLPGAFTPTCSASHLPEYEALADRFKQLGIDDIVCVSVNDTFVMNAWGDCQEANSIRLIPDGNGEFTDKMGLLVDKNELGFGKRSWRYSMLVRDGIIEKMFIEPEKPGDPFEVSDANTMLNYLAPDNHQNANVSLFTKEGCSFCTQAKAMLSERGYRYEEIELGNELSTLTLKAVTGRSTVPQVYIDGQHIGGSDDLVDYFDKV